jgi:16S rRNA C967 or C1407 C5-methylase (RsmB/RsmF family)/NOL1/NOP2/fmu family ribosome biogenesis protein
MPKLPEQFLNSLEGVPGFDRQAFVDAHEHEARVTSIRLNPFKKARLDFATGAPVPWCTDGFYLEERPYFTHDPLFHAGCYYVQEPGSMFLDLAIRQTLDLDRPLKVLDLCGAPGGKSTLVNSLLNQESFLVSNEIIKNRSATLAQNISRWGTSNTIVTNSEPDSFRHLETYFDALIVDAPCSGSGLFRKQPEAVNEWSPGGVIACAIRQRNLLRSVIGTLKPGGFMYYSTCSYSIEENESMVEWLTRQGLSVMPLKVDPSWGVIDTGKGYRFYPNLVKTEGFFLAVLQKEGDDETSEPRRTFALNRPSKAELQGVAALVTDVADLYSKNGLIHLLSPAAQPFLSAHNSRLYFRKAGVCVGELKGTDLVPDQELAWSLYPEKAQKMELSLENAVNYLKKADFPLPEAPQGLKLVTYKDHGIGWGKQLQRRFNNYLPADCRVLN